MLPSLFPFTLYLISIPSRIRTTPTILWTVRVTALSPRQSFSVTVVLEACVDLECCWLDNSDKPSSQPPRCAKMDSLSFSLQQDPYLAMVDHFTTKVEVLKQMQCFQNFGDHWKEVSPCLHFTDAFTESKEEFQEIASKLDSIERLVSNLEQYLELERKGLSQAKVPCSTHIGLGKIAWVNTVRSFNILSKSSAGTWTTWTATFQRSYWDNRYPRKRRLRFQSKRREQSTIKEQGTETYQIVSQALNNEVRHSGLPFLNWSWSHRMNSILFPNIWKGG